MKKRRRVLVELFGPPAIGGTLAFLVFGMKDARESLASALLLVLLFVSNAYLFAFAPSCVYTLLMETAFGTGLKTRSAGAVTLSVVLGALAGVSLGYYFEGRVARAAATYGAIGAATGLIIGVGVAWLSKDVEPPAPNPMSRAGSA